MASTDIGEGAHAVSSGGIRGNTKETPILERKETPQTTTSMPDYASAVGSLALTPTALGNISSSIAMQSSIAYSKRVGTLLGKNPEGNLLPAFTKTDEAFVQSYTAQAEATLGLQANALINQSENELNQMFKLTPEALGDYTSSTAKGLQGILAQAPDNIRTQLENKYSQKLMDSSQSFNNKMVNQQKEETKTHQEVYNNSQVKDAFQTSFSGNSKQGLQNLEEFKKSLAQQRAAGIIDEKQEKSLYDAAKLNHYSGVYSKGASDSIKNNSFPEYLRGLHKDMPNNLSESEKIQVLNNVMTYSTAIKNAEAQDNQLIVSQLTRALSEGSLTGSMLSEAQQQLPATEFNNFITKMWSHKNKTEDATAKIQELASNFTDALTTSKATPDQLNKAFDALTVAELQKHPDQDLLQVQTGIVKSAGTEVPGFTSQLDTMLTRGDAGQAYRAMRSYNEIFDYNKQNVSKVSKEGQAIATIMDDLHQVAGIPQDEAWAQAREMVYPKNKEEAELREAQYKEYQKDHLSTTAQQTNKAKAMLNTDWFTTVPDLPYVANRINRVWKDWFLKTGDVNAANTLTKKSMSFAMGNSQVNGTKQHVFMPVESLAGINPGKDSQIIIQKDIESNVAEQFKTGKEAYDNGLVDWYYKVKERQDKSGPVEVERFYRDSNTTDTLYLNITASNNLQLTQDAHSPYAGYYDVGIVSKDGIPAPSAMVSIGQSPTFAYRPNLGFIQSEWTRTHNDGLTNKQLEVRHIENYLKDFDSPSIFKRAQRKSQASDEKILEGIK